jgi:hypothetical protein
MFRFRPRTLLVLLAILPPVIAVQYRRWSDLGLWQRLTDAKQERDAALVAWRKVYDAVQSGRAHDSQEAAAQKRYYDGREKVERARARLYKRYGGEEGTIRAMQSLQKKR